MEPDADTSESSKGYGLRAPKPSSPSQTTRINSTSTRTSRPTQFPDYVLDGGKAMLSSQKANAIQKAPQKKPPVIVQPAPPELVGSSDTASSSKGSKVIPGWTLDEDKPLWEIAKERRAAGQTMDYAAYDDKMKEYWSDKRGAGWKRSELSVRTRLTRLKNIEEVDPLNYVARPWTVEEDAILLSRDDSNQRKKAPGPSMNSLCKQFGGRPRFEIATRRKGLLAREKKSLAKDEKQKQEAIKPIGIDIVPPSTALPPPSSSAAKPAQPLASETVSSHQTQFSDNTTLDSSFEKSPFPHSTLRSTVSPVSNETPVSVTPSVMTDLLSSARDSPSNFYQPVSATPQLVEHDHQISLVDFETAPSKSRSLASVPANSLPKLPETLFPYPVPAIITEATGPRKRARLDSSSSSSENRPCLSSSDSHSSAPMQQVGIFVEKEVFEEGLEVLGALKSKWEELDREWNETTKE
ncbi:uncharacterized protein JCM6883_000693 [Sporobolomyces salmoneus]|uniref:uncharacterized protein n=1 Tax=Sporobolomyces salmoneus TaxID=183962 RepID=UPI00316FB6CB